MPVPERLRELATLVEHIDAASLTVTDVTTREQSVADEQPLAVELQARIEWESPPEIADRTTVKIPEDGPTGQNATDNGITLPVAITIDPPENDVPAGSSSDGQTHDIEAEEAGEASDEDDAAVEVLDEADGSDDARTTNEVRASDGGTTVTSLGDQTERKTAHEGTDAESKTTSGDVGRPSASDEDEQEDSAVESQPSHRDPERLQDVYETYDTFSEMTAALETDVTPQTVRHHMIKQGIHTPKSTSGDNANGGEDDASASEQPVSEDGENGTGSTDSHGESESADINTDGSEATSEENEGTSPEENTKNARSDTTATGDAETTERDDNAAEDKSGEESGDSSSTTASASESAHAETSADESLQSTDAESENASSSSRVDGAETGREPDLDDVDLPPHLTLDDVTNAVADAQTLYEVQRDFRLDRAKTRRLLEELEILEFVNGRIATANDHDITVDDVAERIRKTAT